MKNKIVTIFGGSGFIGRYLVKDLTDKGYLVRIICRNPDDALHLKMNGSVGQVVLQQGNVRDSDSITRAIKDSYAVVNLVGILFEKGKQNFSAVHAQAAEKIAKAAKVAGVEKLVHLSAIGVDRSPKSKYARTKSMGEKAVISAFPNATIIRPSVIFGYEDNFLNMFARMAKLSPFMPLIGGGKSKFQPVYVDDVAKAILKTIELDEAAGKVYEIGGPSIYSLKEIIKYTLSETYRKRTLVNIPYGLASLIGAIFELAPKPLLTRDQVYLLQYDNVASPNALKLSNLGIVPRALEAIAPSYLAQYKSYSTTSLEAA